MENILEDLTKFEGILDEICPLKYSRHPNKDLLQEKIELLKEIKISEKYTKEIIDYLNQ